MLGQVRLLLALIIFALSLLATLIRPRGVSEALSSCAGGLLMVAFGLVPLRQAGALLLSSWNVLLFFAGLVTVAWATEQSGFFRWLALRADVGPNLTIVGSLSTVLWLLLLRRRQI